MSIFRRVIGWLREEGMAGQYLRHYESARYTWVDRVDTSIFVPPDAEELADVSFWQAGMDWAKYPHRSAIIRIGQNVWKDTSFETFYTSARARGIALGGYWFFDGRATPKQQADVIVSAMAGKYFELELWVDWERNYQGMYEGLANVVELMQRIEAAGIPCKAVGLYTGYYWFTSNSSAMAHTSQYSYLKSRPLWLAWYAAASVVKVPPPWTDYTLWQWGTPVVNWGQPTAEIDANKSRYSKPDYAVRYLGGELPQPPDGGAMKKYRVVWSNGVARRSAPTTSNSATSLPPYPFDAVVDVLQDGIPDQTDPTNVNKRWVKFADGYFGASDYPDGAGPRVRMVDVTPTEPPAGDDEIAIYVNGELKYHVIGKMQ